MPVAERTYTFRAPEDLGDRMRHVGVILDHVLADLRGRDEVVERIAQELVLMIVRDASEFRSAAENQSAFIRETLELIVRATEKVARDLEFAQAYAREEMTEDERSFTLGARRAAARRWK
jgi:hypothetical protein